MNEEALEQIAEAKATGVEFLDLAGLGLEVLPEQLRELTQLRYLILSVNRLTHLSEWLAELRLLEIIHLSHNQLIMLPESLVQLAQLHKLDVSRNQLTALPDSVGRLISLQVVDAAFNDLSALPDSLRHLELQELWLQGNSRLELDRALLGKYIEDYERHSSKGRRASPDAILAAYFGARDKDGRALNEIKLVLVGRGAAGKTSIVQRLVKDTFRRKHKETQGTTFPAGN